MNKIKINQIFFAESSKIPEIAKFHPRGI